jgi:hypothetical protein
MKTAFATIGRWASSACTNFGATLLALLSGSHA